MSTVASVIQDYFPAEGDVSVPLLSEIFILFDREMDEDFLSETIFISGPDTDQFVGVNFELLEDPSNVSEGDDFLSSPGYTGIVQGTVTFKKIDMSDSSTEVLVAPYRTKYVFTPTHALAALTEYKVNIPEVKDLDGTTYEGYYTFSWTTGSGSIQVLPSTGSTSVLGRTGGEDTSILTIDKTTPADHAIQVKTTTKEIVLEFSTRLDPSTVTADKFTITSEPATDHPAASVQYIEEELIKTIEVDDNKVIISI
jgi:hypothetical protein